MIDFRYHLVSIVAVFLALAVGLVVGSTVLEPRVAQFLNQASKQELKTNKSLYAHNTQLKNEIAADEAFAQAAEGRLLHGLLDGQHVVLVLAPNTDGGTVDGITRALQMSGAAVTGQVVLNQQFFDTSAPTEQQLKDTAVNLIPAGFSPPKSASDPQIAGQQAAAQVIAAAIVNKDGFGTLTRQESQRILTGFGNAGFLQIKGPNGAAALAEQATMAVVVVPGTVPPANISGPFNLALVSLTQDLQEASRGALLAGPLLGSGPHSAIDAVSSGNAGISLTTVDNAETVIGQIIVAQALAQMLKPHASPASYGVRPGTVPSPAPSASATVTPSPPKPTHSPKKRK